MEIIKDEKNNVGKPTISELIDILNKVKNIVGDVKVCSAYDGNWGMDVEVLVFEDTIIIGSIS